MSAELADRLARGDVAPEVLDWFSAAYSRFTCDPKLGLDVALGVTPRQRRNHHLRQAGREFDGGPYAVASRVLCELDLYRGSDEWQGNPTEGMSRLKLNLWLADHAGCKPLESINQIAEVLK